MNEIKKGYVPNEVYKVEKFGNTFKLIDTSEALRLVLLVYNCVRKRCL